MRDVSRRKVLLAGLAVSVAGCDDHSRSDVTGRKPLWRSAFPYAYNVSVGVRRVAVAGGTVVAADGSSLYGFDAAHGGQRWTSPYGPFDDSGLPPEPPLVTGGTAVTLRNQRGTAATLFGIDAATGNRRWVFAGRHKVRAASADYPGGDFAPAVAGGLVHFATGRSLYTLDAATGAVRWRYDGTGGVLAPPVASGGLVLVSDDKRLAALDAATGRPHWTRRPLTGVLLIGRDVLYSVAEVITALDPRTGRTRWSTPKGDWTRKGSTAEALRYGGQPLLAGDGIYLVNGGAPGGASVWALNAADGRVRWSYTAPAPVDGPAVASGDGLYCAASGGHLYALDTRTGRPRWRLDAREASVNVPVVAGGVVYTIIQPADGTADHLYALPA